MAEENDKAEDIVEEDLSKLDDSTDWKAKAQELEQKSRADGIRSRERTKALKEKATELEGKLTELGKVQPDKKDNKSDDTLLQKAYLRSAQITAEDEVELALTTAKKWDVSIDKLVDDEDFKIKLEKLRTSKANIAATHNLKGGKGPSEAKNTPEYWIAKGVPPTPDQVPDRKTRATIARAMMENQKSGKKFYNE